MSLKIGDKAPNFTLPSFTPSKEVTNISLNDFKGKIVVLLFFPQAFTGVCTDEMCTMSENFNAYKGLNAQILGISVDGTFVQRAFAEKNNIPYPLLSDFNREVVKTYDIQRPMFTHGMKGTAERSVYVIDKEGVIRYIEVTPTPGDQVHFDAIKKAVEAL